MSDTGTSRPDGDLGRLIDLIESRALPLLERIALALERAPTGPATAPADRRAVGSAEFREAVDEGRWLLADSIVRDLAREFPGDPGVSALGDELERLRRFAIEDLRERIEAARLANDPEGAIGSRDELAQILQGDAIREVDRPLVRWLMGLVQRRLRTGTIGADVVGLAGRIAESFGGTAEGASLRASLPTLRRSAGLCPRCAEPYLGVGEACPKCLAASSAPTPPIAPPEVEPDEEDPDREVIGEPVDLNNERFWQIP